MTVQFILVMDNREILHQEPKIEFSISLRFFFSSIFYPRNLFSVVNYSQQQQQQMEHISGIEGKKENKNKLFNTKCNFIQVKSVSVTVMLYHCVAMPKLNHIQMDVLAINNAMLLHAQHLIINIGNVKLKLGEDIHTIYIKPI